MTTIVAEHPAKLLTIDEFVAMTDSHRYELVEGILRERKDMGARASYVAARLIVLLGSFCEKHRAGLVLESETIYRCFGHPATARRPDVSFIALGRLPGDEVPEGYIEIPADVAIEVVSARDTAYEVEEKVALYLNHGFGAVWVVYPNTRSMRIHRKGEPVLALEGNAGVEGRGPLAGLRFDLQKIFPKA